MALLAAWLLFAPFYLTFRSLVAGQGFPLGLDTWSRTPLHSFLIIFGLFLLPLVAVALLTTGAAGVGPAVAAVSLGFGLGAEIDVIGFLVSRYFGLRAYAQIYGTLFGIFTLGTGFGPVLMALCFDLTGSYNTTLIGFGASLVCASLLVSRLGEYPFPVQGVTSPAKAGRYVRTART